MASDERGCGVKSIKIILNGQMQSGKNRVMITRKGQRYPPARFKSWREDMLNQIGPIEAPLSGPVALTVSYVPGDNIRRDVPGILDAICHLLERSGLVMDDAQIKAVSWVTGEVAPRQARCALLLEER